MDPKKADAYFATKYKTFTPEERETMRREHFADGNESEDSMSTIDSVEEREKDEMRERWEQFKTLNTNPHANNWELADLVDVVFMGAAERRAELGCAALTFGVADKDGNPTYLRKMPDVGYTKFHVTERPDPTPIERSLALNPCIGAVHHACFSRDVPFGTIPVKYTDRDPLQQIGVYLAFRVLLLATALLALLAYLPVKALASLLDMDAKETMKAFTHKLAVPVLYMATDWKCIYIRMQGAIPLFTPEGEITGAISCYGSGDPTVDQECLERVDRRPKKGRPASVSPVPICFRYGIKYAGLHEKSDSVGYIWHKSFMYTEERRKEFLGMDALE